MQHEQVHLRKKDHTRFVFEFHRYDGGITEFVDFALAVIDASHEVEDSELSADLQLVRQSNSRMAYLMFNDAPASIGDDSELYLWYLVRRARLSARYNLDCLPVDADLNSGLKVTCSIRATSSDDSHNPLDGGCVSRLNRTLPTQSTIS